MRCESCGTDLPEDAAFCPDCGDRTPHGAAGMVDLAETSGLVREPVGGEVPGVPEVPDIPAEAPEVPEAAPLPDAEAAGIPTGGVAETDATVVTSIDRARLREEKRRAAQALVETAQTELREELAEIAERESLIEERGYEPEDVYPDEEPPPPPPSVSAEERMWAETAERAKLHGTEMPWGEEEEEPRQEWQEDDRRIGEKLTDAAEDDSGKCCAYGCVALFVILFLFFVIGFIANVAQ